MNEKMSYSIYRENHTFNRPDNHVNRVFRGLTIVSNGCSSTGCLEKAEEGFSTFFEYQKVRQLRYFARANDQKNLDRYPWA